MWSSASPGERIAAALRRSPVYVDPSLASAVPPGDRAKLATAAKKSPIPIYLVIVPLVKGGTWEDAEQLATVVHHRLGRDGAYVTLDETFNEALNAFQWGGSEESRLDTHYAALTVYHQDDMREARLVDRLLRCIELIAAGRGRAEYQKETGELGRSRPRPVATGPPEDQAGGGGTLPLVAGGAILAVAGLAVWRWRRQQRNAAEPGQFILPRTVLATARQASEDELRAEAQRQVLEFGELLDSADPKPGDELARADLAEALDAYHAASRVLDGARGLPDLAGVLVLVDMGRHAYACAVAHNEGRPAVERTPLCFFNPIHGDAVAKVRWRPIGGRSSIKVYACADCRKAVKARRAPAVLFDGEVPYFEVPAERSVWAATGYGSLRGDLLQRILRGDWRAQRKPEP